MNCRIRTLSGSWYVFVINGELDPFDSIDLCLNIFGNIVVFFFGCFQLARCRSSFFCSVSQYQNSPKHLRNGVGQLFFCIPWKTAKPCRISSFFCESHPDTLQNSWKKCVAVPSSEKMFSSYLVLNDQMIDGRLGCYQILPLFSEDSGRWWTSLKNRGHAERAPCSLNWVSVVVPLWLGEEKYR